MGYAQDENKSNMRFKKTKNDWIFISWNGFPYWSNTMISPNGIERLAVLNKFWENWKQNNRGDVRIFRMDFYTDYWTETLSDYLPFDDNTSGEFWVFEGWDKNFTSLWEAMQNFPRRPFTAANKSNNGLPSFGCYYSW